MERRRFVAAMGITAFAGCSSLRSGSDGNRSASGPDDGAATVGMITDESGSYFDPIGLSVELGDTVTFVTKSGNHSASAYHPDNLYAETTRIPNAGEPWGSEVLEKGESYEHTFEAEGTHDYYCIPHKTLGMVGRIVVGNPGGSAEGSMPLDGNVPKSETILRKGAVTYGEFTE